MSTPAKGTEAALPLNWVPVKRSWRQIRWKKMVGLLPALVILLVFVISGLFAPVLAPHDPDKIALVDRLRPPAWEEGGGWSNALGTDQLGRDILSRIISGARISLLVVFITIPLSAVIGTTIGLAAGWRKGGIDSALMRLVDIQLALPAILFAVLIASVYGANLRNVILVIVVWSWASYARLVRGEVLSLRERDFVVAAKACGATDIRILVRHLFPNLLNIIVILATLEVAIVILIESALSFLGIGVSPGTPSWGAMVSEGRNYMDIAWWLIWLPGIAILLITLTGNLMGDWLRDALDPRLKNLR